MLGHGAGEADLERLNSSAPVLYNHDRNERGNRIGVVERAWIENGRGNAEIRLSKRDEVEGFWQDVRDGILRNVSVSYRINERKLQEEHKDKPDLYRVTSWTPMEISLVDIPADATVGVGRSAEDEPACGESSQEDVPEERNLNTQPQPNQKEKTMPDKVVEKETPERKESIEVDEKRKGEIMDEGAKRALEIEKARRTEIRGLFEGHDDQTEVRDQCLDDPEVDINEARKLLLEAIGKRSNPPPMVNVLKWVNLLPRNLLALQMMLFPSVLVLRMSEAKQVSYVAINWWISLVNAWSCTMCVPRAWIAAP